MIGRKKMNIHICWNRWDLYRSACFHGGCKKEGTSGAFKKGGKKGTELSGGPPGI